MMDTWNTYTHSQTLHLKYLAHSEPKKQSIMTAFVVRVGFQTVLAYPAPWAARPLSPFLQDYKIATLKGSLSKGTAIIAAIKGAASHNTRLF